MYVLFTCFIQGVKCYMKSNLFAQNYIVDTKGATRGAPLKKVIIKNLQNNNKKNSKSSHFFGTKNSELARF